MTHLDEIENDGTGCDGGVCNPEGEPCDKHELLAIARQQEARIKELERDLAENKEDWKKNDKAYLELMAERDVALARVKELESAETKRRIETGHQNILRSQAEMENVHLKKRIEEEMAFRSECQKENAALKKQVEELKKIRMKRSDVPDVLAISYAKAFHEGLSNETVFEHLVRLGFPGKVVQAKLEQLNNAGLLDCGVSERGSWPTEKGLELLSVDDLRSRNRILEDSVRTKSTELERISLRLGQLQAAVNTIDGWVQNTPISRNEKVETTLRAIRGLLKELVVKPDFRDRKDKSQKPVEWILNGDKKEHVCDERCRHTITPNREVKKDG